MSGSSNVPLEEGCLINGSSTVLLDEGCSMSGLSAVLQGKGCLMNGAPIRRVKRALYGVHGEPNPPLHRMASDDISPPFQKGGVFYMLDMTGHCEAMTIWNHILQPDILTLLSGSICANLSVM